MNKDIALEVALQRLQNKERELVEVYALYNEMQLKVKELEEELNKLKENN